MGRSKFISAKPKKVMPHDEFIDRIRKSLYYGFETDDSDMEVSGPLAEYAADLFSEPHRQGHSLNRLTRVAAGKIHATPCSLIMALIYLDRLNVIDPGYVRRITPQELFVVSLMISTKFYAGHDQQIFLEDWAEEGNMSEDKLKSMELEFLSAIDWNVYISNEQFFEKLNHVERTLAQREGLRRGWLTYGELRLWLPSFTLMKFMLNSITVLAVSYAASVMTIAGAFFLASQIPGTIFYHKVTDETTNTSVTAATATSVTVTNSSASMVASIVPHMLPHERHVKNARRTTTATKSITLDTTNEPNGSSCHGALNVETELIKLEQQYSNDVEANAAYASLKRIHANVPRKKLDDRHRRQQHQLHLTASNMAHNWLAFKSVYSDDNQHFDFINSMRNERPACNFYEDCFNAGHDAAPSTVTATASYNVSSALWHLLNDLVGQKYERLPAFWSKLI